MSPLTDVAAAIANQTPLTGKVALVTGAGTGMGRAIVVALAAAGARVAMVGRTAATLEETRQRITNGDDHLLVRTLDVTQEPAVRTLVDEVVSTWGRLDLVVNNAGTNVPVRTVADTPVEDWDRVVATNLNGLYYVVRAAIPVMRQQRAGTIINIASMAAKSASVMSGASYGASKHGVLALSHSINLEEWQHGIRSTCVMPGEVNTPILDLRPRPPPIEDRGHMLQPEDIGDVVLYLATLPDRVLIEEVTIRPRVRRVQP